MTDIAFHMPVEIMARDRDLFLRLVKVQGDMAIYLMGPDGGGNMFSHEEWASITECLETIESAIAAAKADAKAISR